MKYEVKLAANNEALKSIFELRYNVLRAPWLQPASSATDDLEETSLNAFVSDQNGKAIACGRLQINADEKAQIRYMAVSPEYRGKGLGAAVLNFLEAKCAELGIRTIELQARENALNFYEKNGYKLVEKSFLLWDQIQHYLMRKSI